MSEVNQCKEYCHAPWECDYVDNPNWRCGENKVKVKFILQTQMVQMV